ncbi:MAG TPA: hypothetical protein VHV57_07070 [Acidimicrobiales bacterium]|jgi:hypothetical protein|nr:hypothetical protein [Acidimicrobiales bacterium]
MSEIPAGAGDAVPNAGLAEVFVGEIPDPDDLSRMLWTTRCTFSPHGLLGTFDTEELAQKAKQEHLLIKHGRRE